MVPRASLDPCRQRVPDSGASPCAPPSLRSGSFEEAKQACGKHLQVPGAPPRGAALAGLAYRGAADAEGPQPLKGSRSSLSLGSETLLLLQVSRTW